MAKPSGASWPNGFWDVTEEVMAILNEIAIDRALADVERLALGEAGEPRTDATETDGPA
jgi:hypothetical protein